MDSLTIQYIDLKNNVRLYQEIRKFINEQNKKSPVFKNGFGYITVGDYLFNSPGPLSIDNVNKHNKDVVISFSICTSSYFISDGIRETLSMCSDCYPLFYSYIDDRLVLVYDGNAKWITQNRYSLSSKKNISQLVRKTLEKALDPDFEFRDISKKPLFLTPDQRESMSEEDIMEYACWVLSTRKKYTEYYDGSIRYSY